MKKMLFLMLLLPVLWGAAVWGASIEIVMNGTALSVDANTGIPFLEGSGRVMVPLRVVAESAGARVDYDGVNRIVIITAPDVEILVPIGQSFITVNRVNRPNDAPAVIRDSRAFVPIRAVMEALGYEVSWDGAAGAVLIQASGAQSPAMPPVVLPEPEPVPNTIGNSNINLFNGGYLAKENNDLYFVNFEDEERLWRIHLVTGEKNRISQRRVRSVNVVGGWLYYRQETLYGQWELFRAKADGTELQRLDSADILWLKVENATLYYYSDDEKALYRMLLPNGTATKFVEREMASISLDNGWLTYVEWNQDSAGRDYPGDIMKMDLEGRETTLLSPERSGNEAPLAVLIGDTLYFTRYLDALSLYALSINGGEPRKINDRWSYNLTGDNQRLFTLYPDYNEGLFQLDLQGKAETKLSADWRPGRYHEPGLMLLGNRIYYAQRGSSGKYQWRCYDLDTGKLTVIQVPEDFMK